MRAYNQETGRAGDAPTMARQFTQGYLGLQTHGGNDRISYREIQVKDVADADIPMNTVMPSVHAGSPGAPGAACRRFGWECRGRAPRAG